MCRAPCGCTCRVSTLVSMQCQHRHRISQHHVMAWSAASSSHHAQVITATRHMCTHTGMRHIVPRSRGFGFLALGTGVPRFWIFEGFLVFLRHTAHSAACCSFLGFSWARHMPGIGTMCPPGHMYSGTYVPADYACGHVPAACAKTKKPPQKPKTCAPAVHVPRY